MKAALYKNPNTIEISEINEPILKEKGAIIKVIGCGLCGSDIVKLQQNLISENTVLGHEVVGVISQINSDNKSFNAGDKVALGHHVPCFECVYCKNNNFSMCAKFKKTNIVPGGFAEYIYVSEDHLNNTVFLVPENLSEEEAAFVEPVGCCLRALNRANIKQNQNVLVIGLGTIGLIIGQIAKHSGALVTGCDLLDERIELANNLNFDTTLKFKNIEDSSQLYKKNTINIGADVIFMASGSNASLKFALSCIRDGGTIVIFSSVSDYNIGYTNNEIYYRELNIMGSYSPSPNDLYNSMELIKNGIVKVKAFTETYNLCNINQAIEDTLSSKIMKAYIKL